jgi:hypothetical protein
VAAAGPLQGSAAAVRRIGTVMLPPSSDTLAGVPCKALHAPLVLCLCACNYPQFQVGACT